MRDMRVVKLMGTGLALLLASGGAMAQGAMGGMEAPAPDCPTQPAMVPQEYMPWTMRAPFAAAKDKAGLGKAVLEAGKAVDAGLVQTSEVRYVLRPEKPGGSVSFGGLLAFDVQDAGSYRIALGSAAWIDLLEDGKPVVSTAHGHGPACSGIRKMVDFPLKPGRHVLQISANPAATAAVMVMRLP